MKKLFVVFVVMALLMAFAASAMAHPPHAEGEAGKANINARFGVHTACPFVENANGRAFHVLLNWVGPGPH